MNTLTRTAFAAALLLAATPAHAEDAHHSAPAEVPAETAGSAEPTTQPSALTSGAGAAMPTGMMGGDMMKMMQDMMNRHAGMMRGMMADGTGMQGGLMGKMMAPEHIEGRIAFLRTEIKVTDAQQPLWEAVAAALRENARVSVGMMPPEAHDTGLPASLEKRERQLSFRIEAIRRLRAAIEPFYASLDEAQQATSDGLLMPMGMM